MCAIPDGALVWRWDVNLGLRDSPVASRLLLWPTLCSAQLGECGTTIAHLALLCRAPVTFATNTRLYGTAACHAAQVDEVCDTIVAQLARFAAVLAPGPKGAAALGESGKACLALEAMFSVANRWVHGSVVWKGVPGKGLPGKGVGEHIRLASQA